MSCFIKDFSNVQLFITNEGKQELYSNQIGAIGAVIAHFSTKSDPALVAMPTGTGKTAVMVVLSYALKAKKVLVVTPSVLVREQIAEQFKDPRILIDKKIISGNFLPRVYELVNVINDETEWRAIVENHDVVVGIPNTINQTLEMVSRVGVDKFDVLFIDEAHHSRAVTWTTILKTFSASKQILLTATPFRRDKKDIKARLVYNYPLKQAFNDGLFSKIKLITVNTNTVESDFEKNILLAKKTEEVYNERIIQEHKVIIRTDRKAQAKQLFCIYSEYTNLKLSVIHSKLSHRVIKQRVNKLKTCDLDGIICVDMMGEGYDFPALKIATVHIPHKSLAITLQFIGRISRTNIEGGNIATVISGEHEFKLESYQLYKKDTKDWTSLLPELHWAKVQKTTEEQDFFDSFEDLTTIEPIQQIDIDEPITLDDDDLKPFFHAKLYKIFSLNNPALANEDLIDISTELNFLGIDAFTNPVIRHHHVSETYNVSIYIVSEIKSPSWYTGTDLLNDIKNELIVLYYDIDTANLFIGSSVKDNELYEYVVAQLLINGAIHDIIPLPYLKRTMAGWINPRMYNVGMKSRKTKGNSESYKQLLGSLAQKGLLPSDRYSYTRGHSFGGAYDNILHKELLLGISTSSKVWSLEDNKIKYFVEWCNNIARKVADPQLDTIDSPLSELDCGEVINAFPQENIFFADWDASQYFKFTKIVFLDDDNEVVEQALLCSCSINILEQNEDSIVVQISKGNTQAQIIYKIYPKTSFTYSEDTSHKMAICNGANYGSTTNILVLLNNNPIHIFYEDLSSIIGKICFKFNHENLKTIREEDIISHIWPENVNLNKEYYTNEDIARNIIENDERLSIHDYIISLAKEEYEAVFYDHGSLEIADVIGFRNDKIQFYHCKKRSGDNARCEIDDIYEVCGQAIKSVHWANKRLLIQQIYNRAEENQSHVKVKKGTVEDIKRLLDEFDNPILPVIITIVHPGLKTQNLSLQQEAAFQRIKLLLSGALSFLKDVSSCELKLLCA